ncbi:MAG: GDSL-type esterase/lipase family protein [Smithella sp.]
MNNIAKYYKIWLPLLSVFLFFSIAELICRGLDLTDKLNADFKFYIHHVDNDLEKNYLKEDALLMWFPQPHYTDEYIKINSHGFRDREYEIKKNKKVFRILCLGDSSTFGWDVRLQDTYHDLLENRLNKESGSNGKKFEVINAGVPGYTSCQGLGLYKNKGIKYSPDIVTFYFGVNDPIKRFYLSDKQIMQNDIPVAVKLITNNFLLKLHSYRLLRKFIVTITATGKSNGGENVPRVSMEDFKENILELNKLCKENGALLLLISPPFYEGKVSIGDLQRAKDIVLYKKELENIAGAYNIPLIIITEMATSDNSEYFNDPAHPSPSGHKIIMDSLYDYLVTSKRLP